FEQIEGESSVELGERFEKFCMKWLEGRFLRWSAKVIWTGGSGDEGKDIVMEICEYTAHVNEVEITIKRGNRDIEGIRKGKFDFGLLVGIYSYSIRPAALKAVDLSEEIIIVTTYHRMCDEIEE
ncbi:10824_t:CDS:2, partial [Scutellospora calospora]